MTAQQGPGRKSRRDLLLLLLILPLGVMCMLATGQVAIRLAPSWVLNADMRSFLDPDSEFASGGNQLFLEPLDPAILTPPAWGDLFLTPFVTIPTRVLPTATPPPPARTPQPPPVRNTPEEEPTPTLVGPIILPTRPGPAIGDLAVEINDNSATYTPGTSVAYTITIANLGPDDALRFDLVDNVPAAISGLAVTCSPAVFCGTNASSGNTVSFTGMSLPFSGGANQITITISGRVAAGATGNLTNTVEITVPGNVRYLDPNPANNTATDRDRQRSVYDLAITKSDGVDTYTATAPLIYTIVVTNNVGPSDALNIRITDNIPPQIASWTWACTTVTNASGCNGVANSTGNFTDTANIHVGGRIVYTVTANPRSVIQNISNTAEVQLPGGSGFVDPVPANNSATDTDIPLIDLQITKSDGGVTYTAGGTIPYTVTVTNNSTFNLNGITISDPKPAQVTTWSWSCAAGCNPVTDSTANFSDTINLNAGSSLVYNVVATVSGTAGPGVITNTATVSAPSGLVDANPGNNSATDTTSPYIDLQITKTDGVVTYTAGDVLTYTVVVTNNSSFSLNGVSVTDSMPAQIGSWSWTCAPGPGAACTPGPGTAAINDAAVSLPPGGSVTYTIIATVSATVSGDLSNTATVNPPAGLVDAVPDNNTATDINNRQVEYVSGPPDNIIANVSSGNFLEYTLSTPITIDGNPDYEIVFYEWERPGNVIEMDHVIISIGDGTNWYVVYYWGDNIVDTNASPPGAISEPDNHPIPTSLLYGSPYQTGILINADGGIGAPPNGTYPYIRITAPPGDADGGCDVDAIGIWP